MKLDVFLQKCATFFFSHPEQKHISCIFASTNTKLCAVNFQTLSCSKLSTLGNTFSSLYKWIIKPHSLLPLATRQYFWFSEKVKFIALSKCAAATEWKSIRPCVGIGSRVNACVLYKLVLKLMWIGLFSGPQRSKKLTWHNFFPTIVSWHTFSLVEAVSVAKPCSWTPL